MNDLGRYLLRTLNHKRLGDSAGAIAGLASGVSVMIGLLTAHFAPQGMSRVAMVLHLARKPLILQLAPLIAGVAVAFATAAGILRFYSWWQARADECEEEPE
jgi:hypothetical protein